MMVHSESAPNSKRMPSVYPCWLVSSQAQWHLRPIEGAQGNWLLIETSTQSSSRGLMPSLTSNVSSSGCAEKCAVNRSNVNERLVTKFPEPSNRLSSTSSNLPASKTILDRTFCIFLLLWFDIIRRQRIPSRALQVGDGLVKVRPCPKLI